MTSSGAASPSADAASPNPWIAAIAVMFSTLMVFLDTTVVNLSLPYIAGSLSASIDESTWALTSYLAANAVVLPMAGWLANYFGRKRLLLLSVSSFTLASVLCGFAPNIEFLVLFRIVQGLTGGVMQPLSQSVMLEGFPPRDRGKAMGFWSLGIIAAPIAGPLIGGWLTEHHSWRWVFFINVPVGIAGFAMVSLFIFDPPYIKRLSDRIDYWGIGFLALGIGAVQVMLDRGQQDDWFDSHTIVGLAVAGAVFLIAFVARSLRFEAPVVDLRAFADRTFAAGAALSALIGLLLYGSIVLLPLLLQTQLGYPPVDAGLVVCSRAIGSMIAFPIVGLITSRFDSRRLLMIGLLLTAGTMFWFATFDRNVGARDLFWPQFIQGIALGLLFVPLTTVTMSVIPREKMGNASSLFNVVRNLGSSLGIAVISTFLTRAHTTQSALLAERMNRLDPLVQTRIDQIAGALAQRGAPAGLGEETALTVLFGTLQQQAGMLAFLDAFELLGWVCIGMIPLALLLGKPPRFDDDGAIAPIAVE